MKKYKRGILLTAFIIVFMLIIIFCIVNNQHKIYDPLKPNIFEIPGTASNYYASNDRYFEYYFMVQKFPYNDTGIHDMLDDFIEDNYNIISNAFDEGAYCVYFHFMIPSKNFPVYFEENNNYFIMDDYVTHYRKTNEAVCVKFQCENDVGDYTFYHDVYFS